MRSAVLKCAVGLGIVAAIMSPGSSHAVPQGSSTPGVKNCLGPDFDDTDMVYIKNVCQQPLAATWFFGTGHQGSAMLAAGDRISTGVTSDQIPQLGSLRFFACPQSSPVFRDSGGAHLTGPNPDFHCSPRDPHHWDAHSPRTFKYDVLTSGDCVMQEGSLSFDSTGHGKWVAKIHTNHTTNRDIWHLDFNVLDANGQSLFPVGIGDSPAMYGSPSPTIPWAIEFQFDPSKFTLIDDVDMSRNSC